MANSNETSVVPQKKETIWNRTFINVFIVNVALNMGQFMMNSLIPKFVGHLGATATIIGTVVGMFSVTSLIVRPIVGSATGYFKKNILLALSSSFIALAFICYSFSTSIPMVVAGRLIHGMGVGFLAPLCLALASDALPDDKISSGIGVFSLGQAIAAAIGPTIGLWLVGVLGYSKTFLLYRKFLRKNSRKFKKAEVKN